MIRYWRPSADRRKSREDLALSNSSAEIEVRYRAPEIRLGEVCAALIELKPSYAIGTDEITKYCPQVLANFKVSRRVVGVKSGPSAD